jgi:hypothetical protein
MINKESRITQSRIDIVIVHRSSFLGFDSGLSRTRSNSCLVELFDHARIIVENNPDDDLTSTTRRRLAAYFLRGRYCRRDLEQAI